jgi:hypothetical protein
MTESNFSFPMRCISYYASSKSGLDNRHSYEFWLRGKCIRIVCNKPFARGDSLEIQSITENTAGILIETLLVDEWEQEYPVLNFISGRLIYNRWADFKYTTTGGVQILKSVEQILSNNLSIGFIVLCYCSGKISCVDTKTNNYFDVYVNLEWE